MTDPPGELGADPAVTPRIMSATTLDPAIRTAAAPTRQPAVDRMRLLAILAVIVIHCNPFIYPLFHSPVEQITEIVLARLARFAVPFFFVVSGYFLGRALARGDAPMATLGRRSRRLATLFFAWSLFYLLVPVHLDELMKHGYLTDRLHLLHDYQLLSHPWMWLLQGTAAHLWFLPSLLMAIAIITVAERLSLPGLVLPLGAALYLFGLLAGPYGHTPLGLRPGFDPVLGPFFSTIFVALGWALARGRLHLRRRAAWAMVGVGAFGIVAEFSILLQLDMPPRIVDFGLSSLPLGLGSAWLALHGRPSTAARGGLIARIGRHVLGIYAVQMVFVGWLWPLHRALHSPAWELAYPLVVLGLSALVVLQLARLPRLAPLLR